MPPFRQPIALESLVWYLKYVALPVTVGATMFGLICKSWQQKRRSALEGRVVVITGASSGIGEALAHSFYEYGAKVVLAARRESELERVKQDLVSKTLDMPTQEPVAIPLDLAELGKIEEFVKKVYDTCGTIDIVINNGGVSFRGSIINTKIDVHQQIMLIDYFGSVALTTGCKLDGSDNESDSSAGSDAGNPGRSRRQRALERFVAVSYKLNTFYRVAEIAARAAVAVATVQFAALQYSRGGEAAAVLPKMVEKKSGHIVFVSSVQGLIAIPDRSAYAAAKHAMQAFGDCLRAEMAQHNINVSMMSPGYVQTQVSLNALTGSGDHHGVMDKETAAGFTPDVVAKEILDMVVFKKNEVVLSQFLPRFAIFMRHFAPSLYFTIMQGRAKKTELFQANL